MLYERPSSKCEAAHQWERAICIYIQASIMTTGPITRSIFFPSSSRDELCAAGRSFLPNIVMMLLKMAPNHGQWSNCP